VMLDLLYTSRNAFRCHVQQGPGVQAPWLDGCCTVPTVTRVSVEHGRTGGRAREVEMRRPGRGIALATGAAALIGAACAFVPLVAAADAPPKSAADCRAISDFSLRGACWDALDKASQKQTQDLQETKKREFGRPLHLPQDAAIKQKKEDVAREAKQA